MPRDGAIIFRDLVGKLDMLTPSAISAAVGVEQKGRHLGNLGMDFYHAWCDLKSGASDIEFSDKVAAYMGHLRDHRLIAPWRLTRSKLGLKPPGMGERHLMIEVQDLAQLDAPLPASPGAATRDFPDPIAAKNVSDTNERYITSIG